MNIMITGSRGYIGRSMTTRLLEEGHTVVDYNRSLRTPYDDPKHIYAYGDLHDVPRMMDVMKENEIKAVVHIAAQSSPWVSRIVPYQTMDTNLMGTTALLEAARLTGAKRVILYSSECAYGEQNYRPCTLKTACFPRTVYGVTKAATEMLGRAYNINYGMECLTIRCGMVYGGTQITPNCLKDAVTCALKGEKYIEEHGADQPLNPVYIDDIADMSYNAIFAEEIDLEMAVYNGISQNCTLPEACALIKEAVPEFEYELGPGNFMETHGKWDMDATYRDLGFKPRYSLKEGLARYVEYMRRKLNL